MTSAIAQIARLREAQQRITWIEANAAFSEWLKTSLRSAMQRNPIEVMNDLEILGHVLRAWATAAMDLKCHDGNPESGERTGE